ncbi:MAG: hypothetical protein EAZ07_06630 [Cytophagales bacterium]|nr:MAG: hypothetical protein EAZ07_06630 [Cytophagales bacterium]
MEKSIQSLSYKLILLFIFAFNSQNAKSQNLIHKDEIISLVIKQGLDKMYNLEFEESEKIFLEIKKKYPNNPAYDFLMAMNTFIKMYTNNTYKEKSAENLNYLLASLEKTKKLDALHPNDPEVIFFYMSIYSSITLYYSQRKETIKAINFAKKTYDFLRQGYNLKNQYNELYFSAGIYDFYREQYPETHPVYKSFMWLFAPGDKIKAIKELEYAAQNAVLTKTEAHSYLTTISIKYLSNYENAAHHASYLHKNYPNNLVYTTRNIEALLLSGKYEEAEKLLPLISNTNKKIFEMAYHIFKGILLEKKEKKYDLALGYYGKGIQFSKEVEFPVNDFLGHAYLGIARIFKHRGEIKSAKIYFEKTLEKSDYVAFKKEAESNLKQ